MNVTENRIHVNPDKFFEIIAENGLNISELSMRSGCSRPAIYRALDKHRMTRSFYQRIMEVVDISACTYPSTTMEIESLSDLYTKIRELEYRVEVLEHRL